MATKCLWATALRVPDGDSNWLDPTPFSCQRRHWEFGPFAGTTWNNTPWFTSCPAGVPSFSGDDGDSRVCGSCSSDSDCSTRRSGSLLKQRVGGCGGSASDSEHMPLDIYRPEFDARLRPQFAPAGERNVYIPAAVLPPDMLVPSYTATVSDAPRLKNKRKKRDDGGNDNITYATRHEYHGRRRRTIAILWTALAAASLKSTPLQLG